MIKNKFVPFLASVAIAIGLIIVIILAEVYTWPGVSQIVGGILGLTWPITIGFLTKFVDTPWVYSLWLLKWRQQIKGKEFIRCSFAYLYRIRVDGQYLLVKNDRNIPKYQPVGGVYKMSPAELDYLKDNYHITTENGIAEDDKAKFDYRLRVPVRKLRSFVKRFLKGSNREAVYNAGREFREELIDKGLLPKDCFETITYKYTGSVFKGLFYDEFFGCYSIVIHDVVELKPTLEQERALRNLLKSHDSRIMFTNSRLIKSNGINVDSGDLVDRIASHSKHVVEDFNVDFVKTYPKDTITVKL